MLQSHSLRILHLKPLLGAQLAFLPYTRAYSSKYSKGDDEKALEAARNWFTNFKRDTIPESIADTRFDKGSGSGGQKTNKTSSKATTTWPMKALELHVPKIIISELRDCRYHVISTDVILIQCDAHRNRTQNKTETHDRLYEEIKRICANRIPGETSLEQQSKVDKLLSTPRGGWNKFFFSNQIRGSEQAKILRQFKIDQHKRRKLMTEIHRSKK